MKKYFPILLLTFVNVIGFSLLIPIMPDIAKSAVEEKYVGIVFGSLLSAYAFCQFLGAPILGELSDKYGRRPLLAISQLGTTLSWVIFAAAYYIDKDISIAGAPLFIIVILISRITDGITGGNISVAQAYISDQVSKEDKAKLFGTLGAIFGIAFLIGPVLGSVSYNTSYGFLGTSILAFTISLFTLLAIIFYLPESLPAEKRDSTLHIHPLKSLNVFSKFHIFDHRPRIKHLLYLRTIFALVFGAYITIVILLMQKEYELSSSGLGFVLVAIGSFSIINQAALIPKLIKRFGDNDSFFSSISLLIIGMFIIPFLPRDLIIGGKDVAIYLLLVNSYIVNLGLSWNMTTFKTFITNNVSEARVGTATGIDESLLAFGNGIAPIASGALYTGFGPLTFILFAVLLGLPSIYVYKNDIEKLSVSS